MEEHSLSDWSVTIGGVVVESVDEFVYLSSLQLGARARWRMLGGACMGIAAGSMRSLNNI